MPREPDDRPQRLVTGGESTASDNGSGDHRRRPGRVGRIAAAATLAVIAGFWIWAFSPWRPDSNVDRLSDDTYVDLAIPICQDMLDRLAALPSGRDADSPQQRAEQLVEANLVVADTVDRLRAAITGPPDDVDLLTRWIADWELYLGDRDHHVERLEGAGPGDDTRFRLTEIPGGRGVDARIDGFATVNGMEECFTPGDV